MKNNQKGKYPHNLFHVMETTLLDIFVLKVSDEDQLRTEMSANFTIFTFCKHFSINIANKK